MQNKTTPAANLAIDSSRLWKSLCDMAKIGPGVAGGNNRQALTNEDATARSTFANWAKAAHCDLSVDQMGNMFVRHEGANPELDPVYIGSHLDTQPTGGKYDGVLGVLAGLEIVRTLNSAGVVTNRPIVIVNWTNEEGTRFPPAMMASGVFAGTVDQTDAYNTKDSTGKRFVDELERIGWRGDEVVGGRKIHAYLELHIEQGPILEESGIPVGIVTHGQGLRWINTVIEGRESHSGSTPMDMRLDAGRGVAGAIEVAHGLAVENAPHALGTVGRVELFPNSTNIVPGLGNLTVDFRSHDLETLNLMAEEYQQRVSAVCSDLGLSVAFDTIAAFDPPTFDEKCVAVLRGAAERLGHPHMDIISGAGHDACWINNIAPTAMVMCPCVGGISHNESEDITPEWAEAGTNVLLHAVLELAEVST